MWRAFKPFTAMSENVICELVDLRSDESCLISDFQMPFFDSGLVQFGWFRYDNKSIINLDGFSWYRKSKDRDKPEVKPRSRKVTIGSRTFTILNCKLSGYTHLKKYIIFDEREKVCCLIYISDGSAHNYEELRDSKKKSRLNNELIQLIREKLIGRTIKTAYKLLIKDGVPVTLDQVKNQARNLNSVQKNKKGVRPVTNPSDFAKLSRLYKESSFQTEDGEYRFIYFDKNLMSMFVKALPSRKQLLKYRDAMDDIENWKTSDLNKFIVKSENFLRGGIDVRIGACLQVDTTFDISTCFVTPLSGYLPSFYTKSSGKMRHCLLGFMFHSSKSMMHHVAFSSAIEKMMNSFDKKTKKCVPAIIHDGELAFNSYKSGPHFEHTIMLRCDLHRRQNIKKWSKASVSRDEMREIFGFVDSNRFLTRGVFGSLSPVECTKRLNRADINEELKARIEKQDSHLFETHGLKNKILSGMLIPNVTTNSVENLNSKIKDVIQAPIDGKPCAEILIEMMNEECRALCSSILFDHSVVGYDGFETDMTDASVKEKVNILVRGGVNNCFSALIAFPKDLENLFFSKNVNELIDLEVRQLQGTWSVQKKQQCIGEFYDVRDTSENLSCQNKNCVRKFPIVCNHVCAVLLRMKNGERKLRWQFQRSQFEIPNAQESGKGKQDASNEKKHSSPTEIITVLLEVNSDIDDMGDENELRIEDRTGSDSVYKEELLEFSASENVNFNSERLVIDEEFDESERVQHESDIDTSRDSDMGSTKFTSGSDSQASYDSSIDTIVNVENESNAIQNDDDFDIYLLPYEEFKKKFCERVDKEFAKNRDLGILDNGTENVGTSSTNDCNGRFDTNRTLRSKTADMKREDRCENADTSIAENGCRKRKNKAVSSFTELESKPESQIKRIRLERAAKKKQLIPSN